MGTQPADFVEEGAVELPLWAKSHEGLGMDDLATGHGVKGAAEAALGHLGRSLRGATVAIEGFGKVGAGTARACARGGAKIVAVSTVNGLLADPDGLDVELLYALRASYGDRLVEQGGVHLYESVSQGAEPAEALVTIEGLVRAAVERILRAADERGVTPMDAALADARAYLRQTTAAPPELLDELFRA